MYACYRHTYIHMYIEHVTIWCGRALASLSVSSAHSVIVLYQTCIKNKQLFKTHLKFKHNLKYTMFMLLRYFVEKFLAIFYINMKQLSLSLPINTNHKNVFKKHRHFILNLKKNYFCNCDSSNIYFR